MSRSVGILDRQTSLTDLHTYNTEQSFSVQIRAFAYRTELVRTEQSFRVQIRALAYRTELVRTEQSFRVQNRALAYRTEF